MASAKDLIIIGILLLVVGSFLFIIHFTATKISQEIVLIPQVNQSAEATEVFESIETTADRFDILFIGVFIGLSLAFIITGYFIASHFIFAILYMLVGLISVVMATILSNVWETMSTTSIFGTTVSALPVTNHVLLNLPIYLTGLVFIGIIVVFGKNIRDGEGE